MDGKRSPDEEKKMSEDLSSDWEIINKLLRQHGCSPINVTKAQDRDGLSGFVLLDVQASLAVRSAVRTLINDTERRQNLIHDVIAANEQLKQDIRLQQSRVARHEQKASDLQQILDGVRTKIRDLEDDFICKTRRQQSETRNVLQEKQAALDQCQELRDQLRAQEETLSQLRTRLSRHESRETERLTRHSKAFTRVMRRPQTENNLADQQILEIIDGYERQITRLQGELRKYKASELPVRERSLSEESLDLDASPNYKALLKSYQEQIKEAREKHEQLARENSQIQAELAIRPSVRELKLCKQQTRKLERILLQHNISFRGTNREKKVEQTVNTAVQSLEWLPASECRRYLQEACAQLHVQDVTALTPAISSLVRHMETCTRLRKILCDIHSVLGGPRAPQLLYKHSVRLQEPRDADSDDEAAFLHLLPTIQLWAGQLLSLKTLHRALRKLNEKLSPNLQLEEICEVGDGPRVEELLLLVDTMLEDVETRAQDTTCLSPQTLRALVTHFQKLFDVPCVSGVYPRMNEVYSKLGETSNMMRNLQCVLGIDGKVTCGALVNAVWQLCRELEEGESQKMQRVLGTLDIDSVINKVQEHEEFFPAFEGLIKALLEALGIVRLQQILPEVRRLKALASRQ